MKIHNSGVMLFNEGDPDVAIPAAPTNRADPEAWAAKLDAEYDQYLAAWKELESWRGWLNVQKAALDSRLNALRNSEKSKWIAFSPMGIVTNIDVYWG
jgi:hypothetical protein